MSRPQFIPQHAVPVRLNELGRQQLHVDRFRPRSEVGFAVGLGKIDHRMVVVRLIEYSREHGRVVVPAKYLEPCSVTRESDSSA